MDDFTPVLPRDYKGYSGHFTDLFGESFPVHLHKACGALVGDMETHRRVCPETAQ